MSDDGLMGFLGRNFDPFDGSPDLFVSEDGGMCSRWPVLPSKGVGDVEFISKAEFDEWLRMVLAATPQSKIFIPDAGWVQVDSMRLSNWYVDENGKLIAVVVYQKYAPLQKRRIESWMERKGGKQPPPKDRDPPQEKSPGA